MVTTHYEGLYQVSEGHVLARGLGDTEGEESIGIIYVPGGAGTESSFKQIGSITNPNQLLFVVRNAVNGVRSVIRPKRAVSIASDWTWGNDTVIDRIDDVWAYAIANHGFRDDLVHLIGASMGAPCVLNWAARNVDSVASISVAIGAVDIQDIENNDRVVPYSLPEPKSAYGGSGPPNDHNPADQTAELAPLGEKIKMWQSNNDSICLIGPAEDFADATGAQLVNIGNQTGFIGVPGHALVSGFDPDDVALHIQECEDGLV